MKHTQILDLLEEYYLNSGSYSDLALVIDYLQELGSISYFYWITKQWENLLNRKNTINQIAFQNLMLKWFNDCLELQFNKV